MNLEQTGSGTLATAWSPLKLCTPAVVSSHSSLVADKAINSDYFSSLTPCPNELIVNLDESDGLSSLYMLMCFPGVFVAKHREPSLPAP